MDDISKMLRDQNRAMMLVAILAPLTTFIILSRDDSVAEA